MEAVDWLRHEFAGVCKQGRSTPLARFLAWRHMLAMPSPRSPGFDGAALSKAYDELAGLLSAPGADSWSIVSWASRNRHLGALPSWQALPMGNGSGEWDEDDATTGPLDGFGVSFWKRPCEQDGDWIGACDAWSGLGVGRVWISALATPTQRARWLSWCMEAAGAMSGKGCRAIRGNSSATLAMGAPKKPWGESWALSCADWLMACPEKPRDGAACLIEAWARHVDAKWGTSWREPSGFASLAPLDLRPNPIAKFSHEALSDESMWPKRWRNADRSMAWSKAVAAGVRGASAAGAWERLIGEDLKIQRWGCKALDALEESKNSCGSGAPLHVHFGL